MATTVYKIETITLMDGTDVEMSPLKLKYLREFMEMFQFVKTATDDNSAIFFLTECAAIAMKQYCPEIATSYQLEELADLKTVYKILEVAGGIKMNADDDEETPVTEQVKSSESDSWDSLDLVKLESELFMLGIWKNYEELESLISMPEMLATLNTKRELDYSDKKFNAGIQGVNLDEAAGNSTEEDPWEAMKAKVASKTSGIKTKDSNDITSFQGVKAQQTGFGIGMGLDYSTTI